MAASSAGGHHLDHHSDMIVKRLRWRKIAANQTSEQVAAAVRLQQQESITDIHTGEARVLDESRLMPLKIHSHETRGLGPASESSKRNAMRANKIAMHEEDNFRECPYEIKLRAFSLRRKRQPSDDECHRWQSFCDPTTETTSAMNSTKLQHRQPSIIRRERSAIETSRHLFAVGSCRASTTKLLLLIICSINLIGLLTLASPQQQLGSDETSRSRSDTFPSLEPKLATSFSLTDALQSTSAFQPPAIEAMTPLGQTDGAEQSAQQAERRAAATTTMPSDQDLLIQLLKSTGSVDEASKLIESLLLQEQNNHPVASQLMPASIQPADYNQVRASLDISSASGSAPLIPQNINSEKPLKSHLNPDFVDLQPDRVASDSQESPIRVSVEPPSRVSATGRPPARGLFDEILAASAASGTSSGANVNVHYDDEPGQASVAVAPPGPEVTSIAIKHSAGKFLESLFRPMRAGGSESGSELKAAATSASSDEMPGGTESLNNNESITSLLMRAGDASRKLIANYSTWINHEQPVRKSVLAQAPPSLRPNVTTTTSTNSTRGGDKPLRGGDFIENNANLVAVTASDERPRGSAASTNTTRRQTESKSSLDEQADQIYSVGSRHEPTRMRPAARILQTHHVNNLQDDTEKIRLSKKNETGLHRIVFINSMPHWTPARTRTTLKMLESSTGLSGSEASQTEAPSSISPSPTSAFVEMAVYGQETTTQAGVTLNESQVPSTQLYSVEPYELGSSSSATSPRHQAPTTPLAPSTTTERPPTQKTTFSRLQIQEETTNVLTTVARNSTRAPAVGAKRKSSAGSRAPSARSSQQKAKSTNGKVKSTKKRLKSAAITKKPPQQVATATSTTSQMRTTNAEVPATTELAETTIPPSASTATAVTNNPSESTNRSSKSLNLARLFLGTTGLDDLTVPTTTRYQPSVGAGHQSTLGQLDHLYGSSSFSLMPTTQSMMMSSPDQQPARMFEPNEFDNANRANPRVHVLPPDVAAPTPDSLSVFTSQLDETLPTTTTSGQSTTLARNKWRAIELPLRDHSAQRISKGRRKTSVGRDTHNRNAARPVESLLLNLTSSTQVYDRSYEDLTRQTTMRNDSIRRSTVSTSTFSPLMLDDQQQQTDYSHTQIVFPQTMPGQQVVSDSTDRNVGSTATTSLELEQPTTPMLATTTTIRATPAPQQQQRQLNTSRPAGAGYDRPALNSLPPVINQQAVADGLHNFEPTTASSPLIVTGIQQQQQDHQVGDRNYGKRLMVGGTSTTQFADIEPADQSSPPTPGQVAEFNAENSPGDSIKASEGGGDESAGGRFQLESSGHVRPPFEHQPHPQVSTDELAAQQDSATGPTSSQPPPLVYVEPSRASATPPNEIVTTPATAHTAAGSLLSALSMDDPLPSILHHNRLSSLFKYRMANRTSSSATSSSLSASSSPFLLHIGSEHSAPPAASGVVEAEGQPGPALKYPFEYQQIKPDHSRQTRPTANSGNNAASNGNEQAKLNNVALSQMVARLIGSSSGANKSSESEQKVAPNNNNGVYGGNFYLDNSNQSTAAAVAPTTTVQRQAGNSFELSSTNATTARLSRREKNRRAANRSRLQQPRPTQTPTTTTTTAEATYGSQAATTSTASYGGHKNYELIKMGNDDDDNNEDEHRLRSMNNSIVRERFRTEMSPVTVSSEPPVMDDNSKSSSNGSDASFIASTPASIEMHDKSVADAHEATHQGQGNNGSESGLSSSSNSSGGGEYENSENSGDLNVYIKPIARDEQPSNNRWLLPQIDSEQPLVDQKQRVSQQTRAASSGSGRQRVDKRKRRREPPVLFATPTPESHADPKSSAATTTQVSESTTASQSPPVVDLSQSLDDNSLGNLFSRLPQAYRPAGSVQLTANSTSAQSATTTEEPVAAGEYATAATSEQPASLSELPPSSSTSPAVTGDDSMIVDGSQNWKSSSLSPLADDYRSKSLLRTMINLGAPSAAAAGTGSSPTEVQNLSSNKSRPGGREPVRVVKVAKLRSRQVSPASAPSTSRPATTTTILPSSSTSPLSTTSERPQLASTRAPGSRWRSFSTADRLSKQPITPPRLNLGGVSLRVENQNEQGSDITLSTPMQQQPVTSSPATTTTEREQNQESAATESTSNNNQQPIVVVLSASANGSLEPTNLDKVSTLLRATIERVAATTSTRAPATTTTTTAPTTTSTSSTTATPTRPSDTTEQTTPTVTESSLTTAVVQTEIQLAPRRTIFKGSRGGSQTTSDVGEQTTTATPTTTSGQHEHDYDRAVEMMSGSSDRRTTSLNTMRTNSTTSSAGVPTTGLVIDETTTTMQPRRPQSIFDTNFRRQVSENGGGGGSHNQAKRNQRHQPEGQPGSNLTTDFESGNLDERDSNTHSAHPPVARQGLNSFQRAAIVTIIICSVLIVACLLVAAISIKCNSLVASQAADSARRRRKRCDALARLNASGYGLDGQPQVRHARSRSLGLLAPRQPREFVESQMPGAPSKRARKTAAKAHRAAAARRAKSCGAAKLLLSNAELNNSSDGGQQCSSAESTASICVSTSSEGMNFVASKDASSARAAQQVAQTSAAVGAHHRASRHMLHEQLLQHGAEKTRAHKHPTAHHHGGHQQAGYASGRTIRERISGTITSRLLRLHLPRLMPYFTPDETLQQQQFNNQRLANNLSQYQQQQQFAAQKLASNKQTATGINSTAQNFHMAPRGQPGPQHKSKAKMPTGKPTGCAYARREVSERYQCNCNACAVQVANTSSMWTFKENNMTSRTAAHAAGSQATRTTGAGKLPFGTASSVLRQTSQQPTHQHHQQVSGEPTSGGISMMPIPPLRTLTATRRGHGSSQAGSDCLPGDNASTQHSQMDNEHHMLIDEHQVNVSHMPLTSTEYRNHNHQQHQSGVGVYRHLATSSSNLNLMHEMESRYGARYVPKNSDLATASRTSAGDTRHLLINNHLHHQPPAESQDQTIDRIDEVADQDETDNMSESDNYYNLEQHHQQRQMAAGVENQKTYEQTETNRDEMSRRRANLTTSDSRQQSQRQHQHQQTGSNCNCNLILYPL